MNLHDCINRLPQILRGRFSSSNNASWIAWARDGISQIEKVSTGPGMRRSCLGYQLPSGFVGKPVGLRTISSATLDGVPVAKDFLRSKIDEGFMLEDQVECSRLSGYLCMSSGREVAVIDARNPPSNADGALDGMEFQGWNQAINIPIFSSSWNELVSSGVSSGFQRFTCRRTVPGILYTGTSSSRSVGGWIVKSNLVIHGYRSLLKPESLTEELDLPAGSEMLLASYLRWAAENDQDSAGPDAKVAMGVFNNALARYASDQARATGDSAPFKTNFTPTLGMRRR